MTGRGTFGDVRDWSGEPGGGLERVRRPNRRFWTGRGTIGEVRDDSKDPPKGSGLVRDHWVGPGRNEGPSGRSATGWMTLEEVREKVGGPLLKSGTVKVTLREVREGSRIPRGGPGRVGGPSGRSDTR